MDDSVFSVLAAEDQNNKTASRKAVIAANQRIVDSVGAFIQRSSSVEERDQRIALVDEDIRGIVVSACADYGGDIVQVEKTIRERLANTCVCGGNGECQCKKGNKKEASTHESRRPRLCPYHKQVVDISLAQGEPKAGFDAMAQHSWSDKHCESDEYGGDKCKFKPEMTTQSYWTDRTEKAKEKREERQRIEQEHEEIQQDLQSPTEPIEEATQTVEPIADSTTTDWEGEGGSFEHSEPSAIAGDTPLVSEASTRTAGSYQVQQLTDGSGRWKVVGPGGTSQGVYDTQQEAQTEVNMLNRGLNNQNQSSKQAGPMDQPYPQQQPQPGAQVPQPQQMAPQTPQAPMQPQITPAMQQAQHLMGQPQPGQIAPVNPVSPAPGAPQIPPHPNNPGQQQQGVLNQLAPGGEQGAPGQSNPLQQQFSSTKEAIRSQTPCPNCESTNTVVRGGTVPAKGQSGTITHDRECRSCGHTWTSEVEKDSSTHIAERGNDNLGGPSPKMDKRKWTPQNLEQRVKTEEPGSRWPTKEIDIDKAITDEKSDDFLEDTRAGTETQDVTKTWKNPGSGATKTFDGKGQATPVTSSEHWSASMTRQHFNLIADALKSAPGAGSELANHFADRLSDTNENFNRERFINAATPEDSEKESSINPLHELLEEEFSDPSQVTSAISQYREE